MFLTSAEAISFILACGGGRVSSKTKLNKLLARLNLHFVPVDIDFRLNKFGSFSADLEMETTDHYRASTYAWHGGTGTELRITPDGHELAKDVEQKLRTILSEEDISSLKAELAHLHALSAEQISADEHAKLFVDVEDRHKLRDRINSVHIDLIDLYAARPSLPDSFVEVTYCALVEYALFLSKYLKEKRFKDVEANAEYGFDDYMLDYYFLYTLEQAIPVMRYERKNEVVLNKFYQYFVNSAKDRYPFSLENEALRELAS